MISKISLTPPRSSKISILLLTGLLLSYGSAVYVNLKLSVMRFKWLVKHLVIPQSMGSSGQNRPDLSACHSNCGPLYLLMISGHGCEDMGCFNSTFSRISRVLLLKEDCLLRFCGSMQFYMTRRRHAFKSNKICCFFASVTSI